MAAAYLHKVIQKVFGSRVFRLIDQELPETDLSVSL
jgi:phage baseplate assembly protein W